MRFAMVTTFYPPYNFGGDAQTVQRLTHALADRGHEVHVVHDLDAWHMMAALRKLPAADREPAPPADRDGVVLHRLRSKAGALSCLATQQMGRPVFHGRELKKLLSQNFDVIHFHNVSLAGGPGVLAYGDAVKLYYAHEYWLVCETHFLWRDGGPCPERDCLRCVINHRRPPQLWRATSWMERSWGHIDAFMTYSRFSADKHREFGFPHRMDVFPGFLADSAAPAANVRNSERPTEPAYFLFAGRLEQIKGLQDVIPHFLDGGDTELWVAGRGTYEGELKRLAAGSPRIRFLGFQTPEDLRALYRNAIALVVPSKFYETFGLVVIEAFREGTPVVARNLGPLPEIIEQSGGGLLFSDQQELKAALARLSSDEIFRSRVGRTARAAFEAHYSEEAAMRRYFALIEDASARRNTR